MYYIVKTVDLGEVDNKFRKLGIFDANITCSPFQYSDMPAINLTAPGTVYNPGTEKSLPYIKVTGTGAITLDINGRDFLMNITDYIEIDSELGYTYRGTAGMDDKVNGALPYLDPGANVISWTGTVTKVEINTKAVYV